MSKKFIEAEMALFLEQAKDVDIIVTTVWNRQNFILQSCNQVSQGPNSRKICPKVDYESGESKSCLGLLPADA